MSGTVIENLSCRKLAFFVSFLFLCQLACFLIGGLVAPRPMNRQMILGTLCEEKLVGYHHNNMFNTKWSYYSRRDSCKNASLGETLILFEPDYIAFDFQIPVPHEGKTLMCSRWQQYLIGVMEVDMKYYSPITVRTSDTITIDARLAYRNKGDPEDKWTFYAQSSEYRPLKCDIVAVSDGDIYTCSAIPLFEFGSLFHDYYLLNVRLVIDGPGMYTLAGNLKNIWMTFIYQNGDFTKVWLGLKTLFLPFIIAILVWFWRHILKLSRKPVLLEKMLLCLGIALSFLNLPIEYLTLYFDLPFVLLLGDIRQGVFYVTLFSFWLVFAGEHMLIHDESSQSSLIQYWRQLSGVVMGCVSLLIFDICKRGRPLRNPFHSIWATYTSTYFALSFIIVAGISAAVYLLLLYCKTWQGFSKISHKTESLATRYSVGRLHSEGITYRFTVLKLATLICATFTVIEFILRQVAAGQWKWNEHIELEYTSVFFTGVYGMWNIYIFALVVLYAPYGIKYLPKSI